MLSFFPRGILDEILNLIESVSEVFSSYPCFYSSLYLSIFYPVLFVFFIKTIANLYYNFFATYLLLHIHIVYSSVFLKQCSGAIVRFSDSSSRLLKTVYR